MSRIADVVQTPGLDRRISHRQQSIPCGRCYAVIEYDRGTEWSVVSKLVNEHWNACPGKPHANAWPTRMASTPTSPPDTPTIALPPPLVSKQHSGLAAESVGSSSNSTWFSPGCERKRRTLEQRKLELEQDEYAKNVTTKSVVCVGCHKEISLDKRSKYYPGLWLKHRGKCPGVEKLERAKARVPQTVNGKRHVAHVGIPAYGHGDARQVGSAERYEGHDAAAPQLLVRHYDSENQSSEDEDEEADLLFHEPFPTLNGTFYRAQQHYDQSEWTYRYATKDEITTNLFRGQDELYGQLSERPFSHLRPQIGDHCGASRCVIQGRVDQAVSNLESFRSTKELSEPGKTDVPCTNSWQDGH